MNTEDLGNSKILNLLFKPAGMFMGSKARRWLMNPMKTLQGAGIHLCQQTKRSLQLQAVLRREMNGEQVPTMVSAAGVNKVPLRSAVVSTFRPFQS